MSNTVTVNGHTYTDDDNPSTGLGNGGHRARLVPMLSDAVVELAAKAALATTNGAVQVTLAAAQAALATTNGAVQVTLAAAQAALATTGANTATTKAGEASSSQIAAAQALADMLALYDQFDDRYLGSKAADPTVDNDGNALQDGAFYINSVSGYLRAYTAAGGWVQGIAAVAGVSSVNGQTGAVTLALLASYTYDNRSALRALTPAAGDAAVVDGLGMFVWQAASDEPDDDESCFATATGRWLLQAAHWDLVDAWQMPDDQARDDDDEDEPLRFVTNLAAKVLTGTATCSITQVSVTSSTSFTGTVTGAAVGDRVIATPPGQLGDSATTTSYLSFHAWVSATNTVTVMLSNNSTVTAATTNTAIRTAWPITIIKT